MKKVLESELLAQLRRDMVDAAVRITHANAEFVIRCLEDNDQAVYSAALRFSKAEKDYRKALDAFTTVARENIATLPDEA